ncbi:AAA family ATPase [Candidatus Woesebacteria bacterium]|nr:AAA family ATPase [Candidatus Woesebacteria bacterium]
MSTQSENSEFKYNNITISGLPGSGSTTLLNMLKTHKLMKFNGWSGFSGGEFMRAYAKENGLLIEKAGLHHDSTIFDDEWERQVDMGIREKLADGKGWIIDSWLSGFLAQNLKGTLKVLMVCSDKAVKIDRIVNRDSVTPHEAIANMNERYNKNLAKWQRMYANEWNEWVVKKGKANSTDPIDFWRHNLYDVVIDTYSKNQQETLKTIIDAITK